MINPRHLINFSFVRRRSTRYSDALQKNFIDTDLWTNNRFFHQFTSNFFREMKNVSRVYA